MSIRSRSTRARLAGRRLGTAHRLAAGALALSLVAVSCGKAEETSNGTDTNNGPVDESTLTPTPGGSLVYALEADPGGGTSGFCIPEAQFAISGIMISRTIYDTLAIPNEKGDYVGALAESITPNATFDSWDVKLRSGIKFHDGTPLTATVVKNNLDSWVGKYPGRSPLLFTFVYANLKDVTVKDDLTVTVTTKTPWPAFPAYLWNSGRSGIMGQSQLDSKNCATELNGTGPFKYVSYTQGDSFEAVKNPNYWQKDAKGVQLPYLDKLTYKFVPEGPQRVNGLVTGDFQIGHTSGGDEITDLRTAKADGKINLIESDAFGEVSYSMLNSGKEPFSNKDARLAVAYGVNTDDIILATENGVPKKANGPFNKGNVGYLEDTGFPTHDEAKAKEHLAAYTAATGKKLTITLGSTNDAGTLDIAKLVKSQAEALGVTVNIDAFEQGQLINKALEGNFDALLWRNHPGGDPDTQYVWWHSGSPVNFGKINDPEIDRLLDAGRVETDPAKRKTIYEDLNKRFGSEAYNLWSWFTLWSVASGPKVHGVYGPDLPDGSKPNLSLATGHSVAGLWVEQ